MKKQLVFAGALAVVAAGAVILPKSVDAYRGDPSVQGPAYTEERHTAMTDAFAKNDYEAWKKLMEGRGRVVEVINEGNFEKFAYAHKLSQEGKVEEAKQVRAELGLGLKNGQGGKGRGYNQGNCPGMAR